MVAVATPPSALAPRGVTVLGATGTIGRNTLDLIARDPAAFRVEALTAQQNVDLLAVPRRLTNQAFDALDQIGSWMLGR